MSTPAQVVQRIVELALAHPSYGCNRLQALLLAEGRRLSAVTIQKILQDHALGSRHERWLALQQRSAQQALELSAEQIAFIERHNPCFRERHVESSRPGELLSQDTFFVGSFKSVGKVYMHSVVDTYGSYGFGLLHISKQPEAAVAVLHNDVLPFYRLARAAGGRHPDRQRPRVLRHAAPPLRAVPAAQRHRASPHPGAPATNQRVRGALAPQRAR
ncbi:hypothetical protein Talka_02338 [Tepidimonas alkaliphilus]|uniref:Integrase core domain protein n=1 Tax=Tepidimonas alkaliphilus TaxID=2588942 RepID=A0A554W3I1_9BURK|nr:hypothetical protein Talka_02338 [Tepidimonas alkaliphilus]